MDKKAKEFYEKEYCNNHYALAASLTDHPKGSDLQKFINMHQLIDKKCLEVGCGRGTFQNIVKDYTGIDIANNLKSYFHKPFFQGTAINLPFKSNQFDAIWTINVIEHVEQPEKSFVEIRRTLKNGGYLFLSPAWQCRSWAANGYPVRPYGDFNLFGKIVKASIPIRNSILFRSIFIFPKRLIRLVQFSLKKNPIKFSYKKLKPNYEKYWMSDSDATSSMDPFEAILWFTSRGDKCLSHQSMTKKIFVRTGSIIFKISK